MQGSPGLAKLQECVKKNRILKSTVSSSSSWGYGRIGSRYGAHAVYWDLTYWARTNAVETVRTAGTHVRIVHTI